MQLLVTLLTNYVYTHYFSCFSLDLGTMTSIGPLIHEHATLAYATPYTALSLARSRIKPRTELIIHQSTLAAGCAGNSR